MDFKKIGIDQIEDIFVDRVSTQIIDGSKRFSSQILAPSIKHRNALSQDVMFVGAADSAFGSSGSLDGVVYMYGGDYMVVSGPSIRFKITDDGSTIIGSDLSDYVSNDNEFQVVGKASFSDIATAPTATPGTNTNQIATTAFVQAAVAARPYKVYTALVTQTGTGNPSVVVLENTLGITGAMSRNAVGHYSGSFLTNQVYNKVACFVTSNSSGIVVASYCSLFGSGYWIDTAIVSGGVLTPIDGALNNATLEIRVYN